MHERSLAQKNARLSLPSEMTVHGNDAVATHTAMALASRLLVQHALLMRQWLSADAKGARRQGYPFGCRVEGSRVMAERRTSLKPKRCPKQGRESGNPFGRIVKEML
jgi:hypothetical protein